VVWFSLEEPGSRVRDFIDNHCRTVAGPSCSSARERRRHDRHPARPRVDAARVDPPAAPTFGGTALFNVANAMAAAGAAFASGAGLHEIRQGLRTFTTSYYLSPGRMNQINVHNVDVIVDYCHNAPGMRVLGEFLERYAATSRQTDLGKISRIGMVATAGDRARERHARAGSVAAEHFDVVVVREDQRLRGRSSGSPREQVAEGVRAGSASRACAAARSRSCSTRPRPCATSWHGPTPETSSCSASTSTRR
jgi:cyanophycin synthetase